MRCYVLAFPVWSREIGDRVEAFRAVHDPPGIAAHFTLVFGVTQAAATVAAEANAIASRTGPVPFTIRRAARMQSGDGATLCVLVPDQGQAALGALHDGLHRGALAPEWRLDIDFTPHLTIGRAGSGQGAQAMCDRWNEHGQQLIGHIDTLTVGTLADGHFCIHSTHPLRAP